MAYTRKTETYTPRIEHDIPVPDRQQERTVYIRKMPVGMLEELAKQMKPGDSVVLPSGSASKLKTLVKERGLTTTSRVLSPIEEARVWVIKP